MWGHSARGMVHTRPASTTSGQARAFPTHAPIPGFARNAELVAVMLTVAVSYRKCQEGDFR